MKKIIPFLLLTIMATFLVNCEPDDPEPVDNTDSGDPTGTVTLRFEPYYQDEPLEIGEVYTNAMGYRLQIENLDFYISNTTITDDESVEVTGSEIELLMDEDPAMEMSFEAATGNYSGLSFSFGIPSEVNTDSDPTQFPNSHPLSVEGSNGMFWTWNTGYIFTTFDGRADTTGIAGNPLNHTFAFHCGNDQLFETRDYPDLAFEVAEDQENVFVFRIQVDQLLDNPDNPIDLKEESLTHSSGEDGLALAIKFTNNFYEATTLE